MSADDPDTIDASLRVAHVLSTLSNDLCILISKIVRAQSEADDLLDQAQGLGALIRETATSLRARKEARQNETEATPDELVAENNLYSALCGCKIRLREMKSKFSPLQNATEEMSITEMRNELDFDPNIDLKEQQDRLEWQYRRISIALQMLEICGLRGERARLEADRARFAQLARLSQECRKLPPGGPPSGPVSPQNDEAEFSTPPRQSGETGMPEPDDYHNDNSGAGDDPIDTPISGAGEPSFGSTGAPSREAAQSNTLLTIVKMKNPRTQIPEVKDRLRTSSPEEIRVRDDDGWTLLHYAVLQQNVPLLTLLLRRSEVRDPAFLNTVNSSGHTALMEASRWADHERGSQLAHLLLEHGCEVNVVDGSPNKRNALYFVVERSANKYSRSVAKALLEQNADVSSISKFLSNKDGYPDVNEAVRKYEKRNSQGRGSFYKKFSMNSVPRG